MSNNVIIGKGKLAGKGVYAARDFKEGELVKYWDLKSLTQADFDELPRAQHMFVHTFGGKMFLFPEPSRYTNHSANPTVRSDFKKQCDYAIRPLKKGEMITINATLEVQHELETFIEEYEKTVVSSFKWLKGGYRNAVVTYLLPSGKFKTLAMKRVRGNWRIVHEHLSKRA